MAKKAKPKSKRTQVKDLAVEQQELTTDESSKVKGGIVTLEYLLLPTILGTSKPSPSLSPTKPK